MRRGRDVRLTSDRIWSECGGATAQVHVQPTRKSDSHVPTHDIRMTFVQECGETSHKRYLTAR